ncbi:cytochrome b [Sandarakinorhabdus sp.]|uniref:cytochrome b n=1 Tax=Sandarakinorhabdus sp. TaxID=1916663 RepID=UPI00286E15DB|nr:cytochrome b [Sandarakinorhabdus sp.]
MTRYSRVAIILHWLMALMIIGNLAGGFLHDYVPREGGQRAFVMGLHVSFGLTIIALTLVRLGWRLANAPPPLPAYFTSGERLLAKAAHWAFYVAMLALPLSGWLMAERNERPLLYFFAVAVPKAGIGKPLAETFNEVHEILGWTMLALLAVHIIGIIKHLVMDRDNLLPRMGWGTPRA